MHNKVTMQSPDGEIREVEAAEKALVPLMVAGWVQAPASTTPATPAEENK